MVPHEGLVLVAAGCGIGLAGSLLFSHFIRNLLFEVAGDPVTLGAASHLLAGIAPLACYLPARLAARVDRAVALRGDPEKLRPRFHSWVKIAVSQTFCCEAPFAH